MNHIVQAIDHTFRRAFLSKCLLDVLLIILYVGSLHMWSQKVEKHEKK